MKAVGLTDHGTIAGIIDMLKECRKQDIKPILGMETYIARDHRCRGKKCQPDGQRGNKHLNIIAKDLKGYQNLCTLSQIASLDGFYYDPRIDFPLLEEYKDGLIVTSACIKSIINWNLLIDRYDKAKEAAVWLKDIFDDDFYLEVMYHGLVKQGKILPDIQRLSKELDVKMIATNDTHYVNKEDAKFQEILVCMSTGRSIRDPNRLRALYNEFYFKSAEEMRKIFGHIPSALTNTVEIAEKCDYSDIRLVEEGGQMLLPAIDIPSGFDGPYDYLVHLAKEGIIRRGWDKSQKHVDRLERELSDIALVWKTNRYDFSTYFLIVRDMMQYARNKGISAGVRGSGYGSVLLHCLGICEGLDPVEHGLIWERFLGFINLHFISEEDFGINHY